MKKLLAFSGSMSKDSINQKLVEHTVSLIENTSVEIVRLYDFDSLIYSKEREEESGIPEGISSLREKFDEADGFILSTPEYNGSIPGGLKNTLDWLSRTEGKIFQDKPLLLMATSPGGRGGQSVLEHLSAVLPYWGAKVVGPFSLPSFQTNLVDGKLAHEFQPTLQIHVNELLKAL